ncbi:4-hydroxythreonine-4-phosphate dehydrogenase PdxA [Aliifodinibius salipaludis]|uniref:4-hydroxythreonine-4-phosphate dehydrogenase PdxA n=1 Tax=Fodinibius salipaludis TaxID=2032627 RepID=A0A2A2GD22_9BACT|nr:4-hydroxythreonine-4-phosphate dehydrogenase PdxA [Aliifodinibius salipaludis]PAU95536.1 4-hydroxythreonine-4-phosphate dehydrogenase PdxA [Aliifodinibius salipaludis]
MQKRIAISIGDVNGIGPEVVIKSLLELPLEGITPVILSSKEVLDWWLSNLSESLDYHYAQSIDDVAKQQINLLETYTEETPSVNPGDFSKGSGKCAMLAVEKGISLCKSQQADALVTAPISKEAVNLAGYHIPGHTEFLAEKTNTSDYMMMLVHKGLRVGLVTGHIPVSDIAPALSTNSIKKYIRVMHNALQNDFNLSSPNIAVLGLNPHAGDGGIIGTEEIDIITPAIEDSRSKGLSVSGPHPADGFFGNRKYEQYDGIVAMYHDQGLIPFKTLSFGGGVNFTAGLPIIRTSPDHGTAFDIAGQNKATPSSFIEAFRLASELIEHRSKQMAKG